MGLLQYSILVGITILAGCNLVQNPSVEPAAIIVTSPPFLTCEALVASAIDLATQGCIELDTNEVCYGHAQVVADFQTDNAVRFELPGDIADLSTVRRISTAALSEEAQTWGVALLKASIQQQEVTVILFGDATLDNPAPDMSAATLSTRSVTTTCAPPSAMLVQSPTDSQVTITLNSVEITLGSTTHITAIENQAMTIATIEGTGVVAAFNATRIVRPGAQVRVPLDGLNASGVPSEPVPFDLASIQRAPLALLDRPVQLPQPIAGPTIPPISSTLMTSTPPPVTLPPSASLTPTACAVRSDWTGTYTVQRGDNLSSIARRYGRTVHELQEGNCIPNPDLIRVGQVLQVPGEVVNGTPTTAPTNVASSTPTTASFRADQTILAEGQCTTIRWDVDNVSQVYFEDELSTGHDSQEVCPTDTTSYRLTVVNPDGRQVPYTLRIEVAALPAATEEPR